MSLKGKRYNNLHFNNNMIPSWLEEYCKDNFSEYSILGPELLNDKINQNRYKIKCTEGEYIIDFFHKKDKTTTISPVGGGDKLMKSKEIADFILTKIDWLEVGTKRYNMSLKEEDFTLLIEYLSNLEGVTLIKNGEDHKTSSYYMQFQNEIGDKVTVTYYKTTKKFLFDGKVLNLYQEINYFLSAIKDPTELIKKEEKVFEINVDYDLIGKEIKNFMPFSHDKIGYVIKTLLTTALTFNNIKIELPEYSTLAFPALRGLEGYMKLLFGNNDIIIDSKNGFCDSSRNPYFVKDSTGKYVFKSNELSCPKTIKALEECYNYYSIHRHTLFHTDAPVCTTRLIMKREEADNIIWTVLNLVEQTYKTIV